jgi:hypothetical protein
MAQNYRCELSRVRPGTFFNTLVSSTLGRSIARQSLTVDARQVTLCASQDFLHNEQRQSTTQISQKSSPFASPRSTIFSIVREMDRFVSSIIVAFRSAAASNDAIGAVVAPAIVHAKSGRRNRQAAASQSE